MIIFLTLIDSDEGKERFIRIYDTYRKLMFHVAFQILQNNADAEDAVQEAFFKVAENIEKISDPVCPKTKNFVVLITERKAIDILRGRKKHAAIDLDEVEAGYETDFALADSLTIHILKMQANYREVIMLKYYFGYSLKEIAAMLDISLANARKLYQRAKARLREILKEDGYDI